MTSLKGKTALITGGSDGIGFAVARAFAGKGADLVIVGRDREKLDQKAEALSRYGGRVLPVSADMGREEAVDRIADAVSEKGAAVDIIVNNVGIARFIPFSKTGASDLDLHYRTNLRSPYLLTRAFLDHLVRTRGNVINISSYFARRMLQDRPSTAYSATKGALESFTRALAFELGPQGVRVNAIAPGTVSTPQVAHNLELMDRRARERFSSMVQSIYPMQRLGSVEDVANMARFLASDEAAWITGGIFPVDGGLTTS